jgi:FkbM family methyltransferase
MFLDNLLPAGLAILWAPQALVRRVRYPQRVSFGLLANLYAMRRQGKIHGIDSIWDVGANEGQFAFMAHSVWPGLPVYSFEPDPDCFKTLISTFAQFAIPGRAFPCALGSEKGEKQLIRYSRNVNNSFLQRIDTGQEARDSVQVQCDTLDAISKEIQSGARAFLKLDVQGFELAVLAGAVDFLAHCHYVQIEVSFASSYSSGARADEVMRFMREHEFQCIEILDLLRNVQKGTHEIIEVDLLFRKIKKDRCS